MVETYLAFTATAILLALTPGPDVLLVIATAARVGFGPAFKLTLGFATGCLIHTLFLILGLSVLIAKMSWSMILVTFLGACYLLYLAFLTWMYRSDGVTEAQKTPKEPSYWRGVIMNISNPKVLLFFLALFPQFASLDQPGAEIRLAILGLLFALVTLVVFGGLGWLTAHSLSSFFHRPVFRRWMDWVNIFIFISLALLMLGSIVFF